jgi:hypothetical protein
MHLQIAEAGERVSRRYVADGSHGVRQCRLGPQKGEPDKRLECSVTIRAWGMPLPNIGLWTATQAAPKAPQRKRPCRSRALSLILTVRSLNSALASPDEGLVARFATSRGHHQTFTTSDEWPALADPLTAHTDPLARAAN